MTITEEREYRVKVKEFVLVSDEGLYKLIDKGFICEPTTLENAKEIRDNYKIGNSRGCQVLII